MDLTGGMSGVFSGVKSSANGFVAGLTTFIGTSGVLVLYLLIFFGIIYWIYWYFIKNNYIVMVKRFGSDRWIETRGRETNNRKTKEKGFAALRMSDYSGAAIPGDHIGYIKRFMSTRPIVFLAYDKDHNVHPVKPSSSEALMTLDVLSPLEKEILLNQIEKSSRKYRASPEQWMKTGLIVLVVSLLIVFGGTGYVSYKNAQASTTLSGAVDKNTQSVELMAKVFDIYAINGTAIPTKSPTSNGQFVTPLNNIVTG